MAGQTPDIAGLVRTVIEPLVDHTDDIEVTQTVEESGDIYVEIQVNAEDTGKVIGRQGRVIKAIRTLARAAGSRAGVEHVDVELPD